MGKLRFVLVGLLVLLCTDEVLCCCDPLNPDCYHGAQSYANVMRPEFKIKQFISDEWGCISHHTQSMLNHKIWNASLSYDAKCVIAVIWCIDTADCPPPGKPADPYDSSHATKKLGEFSTKLAKWWGLGHNATMMIIAAHQAAWWVWRGADVEYINSGGQDTIENLVDCTGGILHEWDQTVERVVNAVLTCFHGGINARDCVHLYSPYNAIWIVGTVIVVFLCCTGTALKSMDSEDQCPFMYKWVFCGFFLDEKEQEDPLEVHRRKLMTKLEEQGIETEMLEKQYSPPELPKPPELGGLL